MVTPKSVVERFKQARLPAGSKWHEVEGRSITTVMIGDKKWVLVVAKTDDKLKPFVIQVTAPEGKAKQNSNKFRLREEAMREAEMMAQAIKRTGELSQAGWKDV